MNIIHNEPAWVLHVRPFRENSKICEFLTANFGKVALLTKMRAQKWDPKRSLLQAFHPILVSFRGRGELPLLRQVEPAGPPYLLTGQALFCGLYLNELVIKILRRFESTPEIFAAYQEAVAMLANPDWNESTLRRFEFKTLTALGFAFSFDVEAETNEPIDEGTHYWFHPRSGFIKSNDDHEGQHFLGAHLKAMSHDLYARDTLKILKYLMRLAYQDILGENVLFSRTLWVSQ